MNKRKLLILTVISIMLAVSCGSSGGSGSGATSDSTPTGENQYNSDSGNGSTSGSGTNNSGQQLTANDFDYYTGVTYVANETTPYSRPLSPVDHLENNRFNSSGKIAINDTDRIYNPKNPDNNHSAFKGEGVAVGVFDGGFNDETNWEQINKLTNNIERVQGKGNTDTTHGYRVIKSLLQNAPSVKIYAMDVVKRISATPEYEEYKRLYDKGVRIFNNSYGNITYIPTSVDSSLGTDTHAFLKKAINEGGALFIWSGGNEENLDRAGAFGNLPRVDPSLEKGWINVVGLMSKDYYKGNTIANVSWNKLIPLTPAGSSKYWSISALGSVDYYDYDEGKTETTYGSSFAAPRVTAAAALVKQAYPFMNGDLIRQTLLSTATDIGDPGVDDVYGWGLLNIDKALNGPALFDKRLALGDAVSVNITDGGTYVFSNDISGDAGLTLTGNGTLKLTGNSTFTGNTSVASGSHLYINGGYRSSSVAVAQNATLSTQNANVSGNVTNSGTISNTGNTTLSSYVATDNSKIESDLDSRINVKGKAELGNSTIAIKAEKDGEAQYVTAKGKKVNVITSDTEVTGNPTVTTTEALKSEKTQDGNSVDVKVSRKNVNEYVKEIDGDQMQKDTAEGLEASLKDLDEKVENNNDESVKEFKKAAAKLQTMSSHSALSTLDSLSGQIYASSQALTFEQSQTINKDLTNRLVMLGTLDDSKEKFGLWLSGIGSKGRLKQDGYAKGDTHTYGGQVGIDRKFGDNLILGAALAYSRADVKFDRYGGKSDADSFATSLYGRLGNKNNPLYLQGRIGVGFVDTDVERDILLSSTDVSRQKINHNDRVVSGYLETGYDLKNKEGDFVVTPFVGLSHDSVRRGAFSETNSQFGLTADKKTYDQTSGLVGLRVGKAVRFNNGAKTTLQGYVTHQRAFNDEDLSFDAHYTGLPGTNFTVKGIGLEKSQTWVGVGALTEFNPRMAWYVNYDAKLRSNKNNNNVLTTGLRWSF